MVEEPINILDKRYSSAFQCFFGHHYPSLSLHLLPDAQQLKRIFRKKCLYYHPDRAEILGLDPKLCTEEFQKLNDAYHLLLPLVLNRQMNSKPRYTPDPTTPRHTMSHRTPPRNQHIHPAPSASVKASHSGKKVPTVTLRFGAFLYRKGEIPHTVIIDALCAQAKHRPKVGILAVKLGFLKKEDLLKILSLWKPGERFLTSAYRSGYLSFDECRQILREQKKYYYPVGTYLLDAGILTPRRLAELLSEFRNHNRKAAASRR